MTDERKPYDQAAQVGLECPSCGAYKNVSRNGVPFKVRLIRSECMDCHTGDRHTEEWYSAPGVLVSQDDRAGYPEARVCSSTDFLIGNR